MMCLSKPLLVSQIAALKANLAVTETTVFLGFHDEICH